VSTLHTAKALRGNNIIIERKISFFMFKPYLKKSLYS
jgi:hypothetical protein